MHLNKQWDINDNSLFFDKLKERNPLLAAHFGEWQNRTLGEYSNQIWEGSPLGSENRVSPGFMGAIERICHKRFGMHVDIRKQLHNQPVVLSAHHTAPLFHPIAIQTLLAAVAGSRSPDVVPVLCTDWIPMDNLFYPRGILIPGKEHTHCINLFGKSARKRVVSGMEPFSIEEYEKVLEGIEKISGSGDMDAEHFVRSIELVSKFYGDDGVLAQESYGEQCALINYKMCKEILPEKEFVFINISELATELLIAQLQDEQSIVYQLLFNPLVTESFIRQLDGVGGCWSLARQQGSVLFWSVEEQRMQPFTIYNAGELLGKNASLTLTPDRVIGALESGAIIPGMALVFSQLMFAEGVTCVGGMRQIVYNTAIRKACAESLRPLRPEIYDEILDHPVDMIVAGLFPLVSSKGLPLDIARLICRGDLGLDKLGDKALMQVVLDAQAELLALS